MTFRFNFLLLLYAQNICDVLSSAVNTSIVKSYYGQEKCTTEFTISSDGPAARMHGSVFGKYEVWAVCSAETKQSIMIFICLLASTIASSAVYQKLPLPQLNKRGGTPLSGNQQRLIHSLRAICTSLSSLLQPVLSSDR